MSMDRLNRKCLAVIAFLLVFAALLLSIPSQRVPRQARRQEFLFANPLHVFSLYYAPRRTHNSTWNRERIGEAVSEETATLRSLLLTRRCALEQVLDDS
jgi:hypothetical protein